MQKGLQGKFQPHPCTVTEEQFFLHPKNKEDLEDIIATWTPGNIRYFGHKMGGRNLLMRGPPGTGKTLGAQYIATRLGYQMIELPLAIDAAYIEQMFRQMREWVKEKNQGLIAFIDEVEGLAKRDEVVDPVQRVALNTFLREMDGTESNHGIFIIGATNKPDDLDTAFRRPGRFGSEMTFCPPDREGRQKILDIHCYRLKDSQKHAFKVNEQDLNQIAVESYGYTGGDLRGVLDKSFARAVRLAETDASRRLKEKDGEKIQVLLDDLRYGLKHIKPSAIRDMPFEEPTVKLADLGGYGLHKELLLRILSGCTGTSMLFYGPEGTGKTRMAEALAGETGYNFLIVRGPELESKWVGESKDNVKRMIERAKQLAPAVLVFDEFDYFIQSDGWAAHKKDQTGYIQSVLSKPIEGVYLIGTMNNPQNISPAFRRRFAHKLYFPFPDAATQKAIWATYVDPSQVGIDALIAANDRATGSDIQRAHQQVLEFGLPQDTATYAALIAAARIQGARIDYDKDIVPVVGDSVRQYADVRHLLKQ
jgi:transitional endoplasmic reticulum ATPase